MDFGKYLKELRDNAGLTQDEAAKKMEVSTTSIQNWEYNKNFPEIENLNMIAKIYSVDFNTLIDMLNKSLNNTDDTVKAERKLPYEDLLSEKFNIENIKSLNFTEKEKDMFVALTLNACLDKNPLPTLFRQTKTSIEAALFIDKLKDLQLIETKFKRPFGTSDYPCINITEKGKYIFDLIKNNQYFDVYSLKIDELLYLAEKFCAVWHLKEKLELLEFIHANPLYLIKTVESNRDVTLTDYPFKQYIKDNYNRYDYNKEYKFANRIKTVLEDDYYELIKEESSDKEYLASKNVYLKKLEVYNANKDLLEDMNEPTFNEVYVEYVKLSEKGEKLYKALEECGYYNKEEK